MTYDEADKLAAIIAVVDGGCSVCVRSATERLMRDFPEIEWKPLLKAEAKKRDQYWVNEVDLWEAAEAERPHWDSDLA